MGTYENNLCLPVVLTLFGLLLILTRRFDVGRSAVLRTLLKREHNHEFAITGWRAVIIGVPVLACGLITFAASQDTVPARASFLEIAVLVIGAPVTAIILLLAAIAQYFASRSEKRKSKPNHE